MVTILIIEDEDAMARGIGDALKNNGYTVLIASDGETGIQYAENEQPDLILLDVMLPGIDGFDVCKTLRWKGIKVPVIMLTSRSEEVDKVVGLEIGADDYITKPYSTRELLARLKAHLRRSQNIEKSPSEYTFGDVIVNFENHRVTKKGKEVKLSSMELSILKLLIQHRNTMVTRDQMYNEIWGSSYASNSRLIDAHIRNLRKKLESDPQKPQFILTFHGFGYKFVG